MKIDKYDLCDGAVVDFSWTVYIEDDDPEGLYEELHALIRGTDGLESPYVPNPRGVGIRGSWAGMENLAQTIRREQNAQELLAKFKTRESHDSSTAQQA